MRVHKCIIHIIYKIMDSLFGDKASITPPAIATSDGPSDPNNNELSSSSFMISFSDLNSK